MVLKYLVTIIVRGILLTDGEIKIVIIRNMREIIQKDFHQNINLGSVKELC